MHTATVSQGELFALKGVIDRDYWLAEGNKFQRTPSALLGLNTQMILAYPLRELLIRVCLSNCEIRIISRAYKGNVISFVLVFESPHDYLKNK